MPNDLKEQTDAELIGETRNLVAAIEGQPINAPLCELLTRLADRLARRHTPDREAVASFLWGLTAEKEIYRRKASMVLALMEGKQ